MPNQPQRWQYPARAGPVEEVTLPTLDWSVQHPDPTRRPPELVHEQYAFTRLVELSEVPIDWLVQHPDPLPNPPRDVAVAAAGEAATRQPGFPIPPTSYASPTSIVVDGGVVQVQARAEPVHVEVAALPDIDWLPQYPDPVQPAPRVAEGEQFFTRLVELAEIPIGWLVQHPDPTRRPPALVPEGRFVHSDEHEDLIPAADWLVQHPGPVLPLPVPPSESVLVEFHIPVPPEVPDIDFIVQHPDPLPKPPPTHTEPELAFEHEDLIPPPDWLVQHPIPIEELRRPPTEPAMPETVEVPPPPVVFDWWAQYPDPLRPEEPRQGWYVRGDLVEIPIDTWLQPPSQPVLPRPPRQCDYVRDLTIPEVVLDQWWRPVSQPVRPPIQLVRFHGELFLVEFAAPVIPFIYVFRECQALWEIIHPTSWESAVASSGYIPPPEYVPAASGYIAEEGGTAPWDMVRS